MRHRSSMSSTSLPPSPPAFTDRNREHSAHESVARQIGWIHSTSPSAVICTVLSTMAIWAWQTRWFLLSATEQIPLAHTRTTCQVPVPVLQVGSGSGVIDR